VVRGARYELRDQPRSRTLNCFDVIGSKVGGVVQLGGGGLAATVITGWFVFDGASARPLMELMPNVIHVPVDQNRSRIMEAALQLLSLETEQPGLGSSVVVSRLADILFVQAIRTYAKSAGRHEFGWLSALSDVRLAPVFRAIHTGFERPWTVGSLASLAGMSRSAFALRFKDRVGLAPLEYLARWRMFRAGALLREGTRTIAAIAHAVGYESEASFTKAFKRATGLSPGLFRRADGPAPVGAAFIPIRNSGVDVLSLSISPAEISSGSLIPETLPSALNAA
jgi:AraC-like DNA-binding protein